VHREERHDRHRLPYLEADIVAKSNQHGAFLFMRRASRHAPRHGGQQHGAANGSCIAAGLSDRHVYDEGIALYSREGL
jgi:hypothetical protein